MIPIFRDPTTTDTALQADRLAHTYNGLTLNDPADSGLDTYRIDTIAIAEQIITQIEPDPEEDGSEGYKARKSSKVIRIQGTMLSTTIAGLFDKIERLAKTFDSSKVSHENYSTNGYLAYDFSIPTLDTATYSSPLGLIPCRYYARARSSVAPVYSADNGYGCFFTIELLCIDPRRYLQSTQAVVLAGSTTATIGNTKADYRSWPTITISMTGAGNAAYTVGCVSDGLTDLTLNLSGMINGDSVVVDCENKKISKNGAETPSLYVSGTYFPIEPSTYIAGNFQTTNGASASASIAWRPAFCL